MSIIDIYKDLKQKLLSIRKDLVLNPGSVINDVFLEPQAYIINKNRVLLEYVKSLQSFVDILELLSNEEFLKEIANVERKTVVEIKNDIKNFIDKIAANFGFVRHPATYATGYAYFGRFDALTFDIKIPVGTEIKTLDNKYFITTEEVIMYANGYNYYDEEENLYLVKVPIKSTNLGSEGNTTAYTINTIINQISGITHVLNKDNISNGIDEESNENFIRRIKTALSGNNITTKDGLRNLILNNFPTIKDIVIIDANDELLERDGDRLGGKTDIYILEESDAILVKNDKYYNFDLTYGSYKGFYLHKQPFKYDLEFQKVLELSPNDYVFVKDEESTLSESKFERSFVYFTNSNITLPLTVEYLYYPICEEIQKFLSLDKNAFIGTVDGSMFPNDITILVKKAKCRRLNIKFILKVLLNYDIDVVKSKVIAAIMKYVNSTLLRSKINQSDIINIVEDVEGVDYVDFSSGIFDLDGTDLKVYVSTIKTEYIRLGNLVIL